MLNDQIYRSTEGLFTLNIPLSGVSIIEVENYLLNLLVIKIQLTMHVKKFSTVKSSTEG